MSSIKITDLSTYKNSTWTKEVLFHPFTDGLVLAVDFDLSADIAATPAVELTLYYEIIEFRTNKVLFYYRNFWKIPLGWQSLYSIVGPVTAHDIGLLGMDCNVFGLRVSIEADHGTGTNASGTFACLAVSDIAWFRLINSGSL